MNAVSINRYFRETADQRYHRRRTLAAASLVDINAFERRIYSQNGEDGILAELFYRLPNNRCFVEIGVEDGVECNSALLSRHYAWRGVMVEADDSRFERLKANYRDLPVTCVKAFVNRDNVGAILQRAEVPRQLDLLSIDIDGNDYFVWEALSDYLPSIVVIEYNATFGRRENKVIKYNPNFAWDHTRYFGASVTALANLGDQLGYALIGTTKRGVNAFFVRRDLLSRCGFPEKTPHDAWHGINFLDGGLLAEGTGEFINP